MMSRSAWGSSLRLTASNGVLFYVPLGIERQATLVRSLATCFQLNAAASFAYEASLIETPC
jgi:hypothetical protein